MTVWQEPEKDRIVVRLDIPDFVTASVPIFSSMAKADEPIVPEFTTNHHAGTIIKIAIPCEKIYKEYILAGDAGAFQLVVFYLVEEICALKQYKDSEQARKYLSDTITKMCVTFFQNNPLVTATKHTESFDYISNSLPAMKSRVDHPQKHMRFLTSHKGCPDSSSLKHMVIHLNDVHKWTREQIADWMDELHDAGLIDIEFKVDADTELPPESIKLMDNAEYIKVSKVDEGTYSVDTYKKDLNALKAGAIVGASLPNMQSDHYGIGGIS